MEFVGNFIQITIPRKLVYAGSTLSGFLTAATKVAGGVTITEAGGLWYDADGVEYNEPVYLFRWNFSNDKHRGMRAERDSVVQAMFCLGEKAVLVERYFDTGWKDAGYSADIYEA